MKLSSKKIIKLSVISFSIMLGILWIGLLVYGLKKEYGLANKAELKAQRAVISIKDEKVLTDLPLIEAPKPPKVETPVQVEDDKPSIAILINGVGLSSSTTEEALKLPAEISLGVSPYAASLKEVAEKIVQTNHDMFINLPMEPVNYPADDPGPYALLTNLTDADNLSRLKYILKITNNSAGIYSMDSEKFSSSLVNMKPILEELKAQKIIYLYGGGADNNSLNQLANETGYQLLISDSIIDKEITNESIISNLEKLEQSAKMNGTAIAIGNPYPITLESINSWMKELPSKNIKLVKLKEVIQQKARKKVLN